ncbi:MAG: YigZ family protein [Ruminococcus sp.]|jgi:uncharacterized YigZ family protein|nr:YigZ family protein [Ruminococcus sp.]
MIIKTVAKETSVSFEIKKSKFIGTAANAKTPEEAAAFVEKIRAENRKSRHVAYAFVTDELKKYSDDGEPQGTAGKPILSVLEKNGLSSSVITVTRYFGGILLGAGPLTGAYTKAAADAVAAAEIDRYFYAKSAQITVSYNLYGKIGALLSEVKTDEPIFTDNVSVRVYVAEEDFDKFAADLTELTNGAAEISDFLCSYTKF